MNIQKLFLILFSFILLFTTTQSISAEIDAQEILRKSDTVRNPHKPFSLVTTLISYKGGKQHEKSELRLYSRLNGSGKQYSSLLKFISPKKDVGKLTLKSGRDLWLYDPTSKASVPISPQQRLLGQASNGDVVTSNWAADYQANLVVKETILDGYKKERECYRLHLTATSPDAAYPSMDLWVDTSDFKTHKAEFYALNGNILKTTYYRKYENVLEGERPTEAVVIDGVNSQLVTVIRNQQFTWYEIPEFWFQRDYLPNIKADL